MLQFVLTWTRWGMHTIATGGNIVGAAEAGVNVRMIKIGNFVLANFLAGFAGILDSTRITTIVPLQGGPDLMFVAVAGAVIGGTSLFGGSGSVIGAFIGVAVLVILRTGFNIIGVSAFTFDLIIGIAIIVVDDRQRAGGTASEPRDGCSERRTTRARRDYASRTSPRASVP